MARTRTSPKKGQDVGSVVGDGTSYFQAKTRRYPIRSKIIHPQLRDLLICTDTGHLQSIGAWGRSIDSHDLDRQRTERAAPLSFPGNCLVQGCGYVAVGGERSELLLRSSDPKSKWGVHLNVGRSIVNSATFWRPEGSSRVQFLVCNNDYSISQYSITSLADLQSSAQGSLTSDQDSFLYPTPSHSQSSHSPSAIYTGRRSSRTTETTNVNAPLLNSTGQIKIPVPVNHCSVSPSGEFLIAVGDSNEVFLFTHSHPHSSSATEWKLVRTLRVPGVSSGAGSFSTAWRERGGHNGTEFAVASEENVVAIWDVRGGSASAGGWKGGKGEGWDPVLSTRTLQKGREGAARKVKFSPVGSTDLLAFTEQQRYVHVLDARTLDPSSEQLLTVPHPSFCSSSSRSSHSLRPLSLPRLNPNPTASSPDFDSDEERDEEVRIPLSPGTGANATRLAPRSRSPRLHDVPPWRRELEMIPSALPSDLGGSGGGAERRRSMMESLQRTTGRFMGPSSSAAALPTRRIGESSASTSQRDRGVGTGDAMDLDTDLCPPETQAEDRRIPPRRSGEEDTFTTLARRGSSDSSSTGTARWERRATDDVIARIVDQVGREERGVGVGGGPGNGAVGEGMEAEDYESAFEAFMRNDTPTNVNLGGPGGFVSSPFRRPSGSDPVSTMYSNLNTTSPSMIYMGGADSWEDIIGMAWSPDGERLYAATEDGAVEWRVDGAVRRGFGDRGLL